MVSKKTKKQTNTNDVFFFLIRSNTNLKRKNVYNHCFPLSYASHCHTHTISQSYLHSINPKRLVINASDTDHHIQPHTRDHIRRANPKKKYWKRGRERKTCEFQRIHIYFNLNQRLDHCSSPYAFSTYSAIVLCNEHTSARYMYFQRMCRINL